MFLSYAVAVVLVSALVTQSHQGRLPMPRKNGRLANPIIIRSFKEAPLITNRQLQEVAQHENGVLRKSELSDLQQIQTFLEELKHKQRHSKSRHLEKPFQNLRLAVLQPKKYNDRGMIYITRPIQNEERNLNKLMNKIVKYKTEDEQNDYLRQRFNDMFSPEEVSQLETILGNLDEDLVDRRDSIENGQNAPNSVFDFSDLVV